MPGVKTKIMSILNMERQIVYISLKDLITSDPSDIDMYYQLSQHHSGLGIPYIWQTEVWVPLPYTALVYVPIGFECQVERQADCTEENAFYCEKSVDHYTVDYLSIPITSGENLIDQEGNVLDVDAYFNFINELALNPVELSENDQLYLTNKTHESVDLSTEQFEQLIRITGDASAHGYYRKYNISCTEKSICEESIISQTVHQESTVLPGMCDSVKQEVNSCTGEIINSRVSGHFFSPSGC
jgi:hypothetical protein